MIKKVVEPLFNEIAESNNSSFNEDNYLNTETLESLEKNNKNMTVVNHGLSHANLTNFSIDQLYVEMNECDRFIERHMRKKPNHFAVPFGIFDSSLCVGLCEVARLLDKKSILWVKNQLNMDTGKQPNKVRQYCRFHTSTSVVGFIKQILVSFLKLNFLEEIEIKKISNNVTYKLIKNPKIEKILAFEVSLGQQRIIAAAENF